MKRKRTSGLLQATKKLVTRRSVADTLKHHDVVDDTPELASEMSEVSEVMATMAHIIDRMWETTLTSQQWYSIPAVSENQLLVFLNRREMLVLILLQPILPANRNEPKG